MSKKKAEQWWMLATFCSSWVIGLYLHTVYHMPFGVWTKALLLMPVIILMWQTWMIIELYWGRQK